MKLVEFCCRICLAEVYQDKSLMTLLEKEKPADPEKPEVFAFISIFFIFLYLSELKA